MDQALSLAEEGVGRTRPNPAVGCVIVRDGAVVGRGYHRRAGEPHAEVEALRDAGELARGATVYVTLEPCSHHGRTPPCAEALIAAGVSRVVAAMGDPNPRVAGRGMERLRQAGIDTVLGVREERARALNAPFVSWITRKRPLVTLKVAASLDGRIATHTGESQWITGPTARLAVQEMRNRHDVVLTGIHTVLADDPQLNCRIPGGRDPVRVVLDSHLRIPWEAKLFTASDGPVWIATVRHAGDEVWEAFVQGPVMQHAHVGVISCRAGWDGRVDLLDVLEKLGEREITSVMVEAGGMLTGAFLERKLADRLALFLAPKLIGGDGARGFFGGRGSAALAATPRLKGMTTRAVGEDLLLEGEIDYPIGHGEAACSPD